MLRRAWRLVKLTLQPAATVPLPPFNTVIVPS
jgi:hypothetical protein